MGISNKRNTVYFDWHPISTYVYCFLRLNEWRTSAQLAAALPQFISMRQGNPQAKDCYGTAANLLRDATKKPSHAQSRRARNLDEKTR